MSNSTTSEKINIPQNYPKLIFLVVVLFIIQAYRWSLNWQIFLIVCAMNAVLLSLFVYTHWLVKRVKNKFFKLIILMLCVFVCLCGGLFTLGLEVFGRSFVEITNFYWYGDTLEILGTWKPELVNHFPPKIPRTAQDIRFSYSPGFLQGGMHMQLRYSDNFQNINQLYEHCVKDRQKSFIAKSTHPYIKATVGPPEILAISWNKYSKRQIVHAHKEYEIMIFDKVKDQPADSYENHGQKHGVAISIDRDEIIYWAESW